MYIETINRNRESMNKSTRSDEYQRMARNVESSAGRPSAKELAEAANFCLEEHHAVTADGCVLVLHRLLDPQLVSIVSTFGITNEDSTIQQQSVVGQSRYVHTLSSTTGKIWKTRAADSHGTLRVCDFSSGRDFSPFAFSFFVVYLAWVHCGVSLEVGKGSNNSKHVLHDVLTPSFTPVWSKVRPPQIIRVIEACIKPMYAMCVDCAPTYRTYFPSLFAPIFTQYSGFPPAKQCSMFLVILAKILLHIFGEKTIDFTPEFRNRNILLPSPWRRKTNRVESTMVIGPRCCLCTV